MYKDYKDKNLAKHIRWHGKTSDWWWQQIKWRRVQPVWPGNRLE